MAQGIRLVQDEQSDELSLQYLVNLAAKMKASLDEQQAHYDTIRSEIQTRLVKEQFKAYDADQYEHPGKIVRAVYSANVRTTVDEEGLKKAIGAKLFNKVAKQKVDMTLLNTAVLEKTIDPEVVQQFLVRTEHPNIRFYVGLDKKEEVEDGGPEADR